MEHEPIEPDITIGGQHYKLSKLTRSLWNEFLRWADSVLPSPLEVVGKHLDKLPPALQEKLANQAYQDSKLRRSLNNPEVIDLIGTPEGAGKLFGLTLKKYHPGVDEDHAWDLFMALVEEHGPDYIHECLLAAQGKTPEKKG